MDPSESIIDPQAEVKKLQDLVKKLEKQNEVLRDRQKLHLGSLQNGEIEQGKLSAIHNNNKSENNDKINAKNINSLDDIDVLDVENLSIKEDEDSWLYSSPKQPTPSQNRISPYKWVRQEFDHPSPDVESARRSLIYKLDEAARLSRSSSTPAFGQYGSPNTSRSYTRMSQSAENTPLKYQNHQPPSRKALANNIAGESSGRIDTGTFTRPKKSRERPPVVEPDIAHQQQHPENRHDIVDVENLAKQQEESLRQSITHSSPRRGIRPRQIPPPTNHVINNNINNNNYIENTSSPYGSNRSSPAKFEGDRRNSQSNSIGSDHSSPPDSPYSSQYLNNPANENSNLRRSLPNVSQRLAPSTGMYSSDPYLDNNSSGGSDDYEQALPQQRQFSRLQPQVRAISPNVSGLRQPMTPVRRGVSPQRTGLPSPARRTIPRPGSAPVKSGVPTPRRSIPSPRPSGAYRNQELDDSWKDGCF